MAASGRAMAAKVVRVAGRWSTASHGRQSGARWRRSAQYRSLAQGSALSPPMRHGGVCVCQSEFVVLMACTARSRAGRGFAASGIERTSDISVLSFKSPVDRLASSPARPQGQKEGVKNEDCF